MIVVSSMDMIVLFFKRRINFTRANTEHKYSRYGDQIKTKVSRFDLEIVGSIGKLD